MDVAVMNNSLQHLWKEYNQARLQGLKKKANQLLADFIAKLKQQEEAVIEGFVDAICTAVLETDATVLANNGTEVARQADRIQHPLFREIILPVLTKQYLQNSSRHIKWIGQFEQFFYADVLTTNTFLQQIHYDGFFEADYFFEKAFVMAQGQDALTLLLEQLARTMDYYLHEAPDNVLATPPILEASLQRFKNYWAHSQQQSKWSAQLEYWERLTFHWTRYNSASASYNDFAHYLSLHNILHD